MSLRLTLISNAATRATRLAAFPLDEALEPEAYASAAAIAPCLERANVAWTSPALRAVQTAQALGLEASTDARLVDIDLGIWAGKTLTDLAVTDSAGLALWTQDPKAAPHGGESVAHLLARIASWMDEISRGDGRAVVVTHAAVIRAATIVALDANPRSFWRIDIEPLRFSRFSSQNGRWTVRCLNARASPTAQMPD